MKSLVIYHDNCLDGFGAAFAAWTVLRDEAEYLPMQHDKTEDWFHSTQCEDITGREIYILDFSFKQDRMDFLFREAKRVVWLDHHASSLGTAEELPISYVHAHGRLQGGNEAGSLVIHDNNKSGAYLSWEYFHPGTEIPMLIQHISDYDLWQFKLEGTKAFNKALWSLAPWSFYQWQTCFLPFDDSVEYHSGYRAFINEGEAILRAHEQNVASVVKGAARECVIAALRNPTTLGAPGHPWKQRPGVAHVAEAAGLAANCPPHLSSDVGHELAGQSRTFGLCWSMDKDGKVKCSLRSNDDYDVSAIAKAFGGGGHRNAAGFEVDIETLLGWLK
jgi:hypothetical protein